MGGSGIAPGVIDYQFPAENTTQGLVNGSMFGLSIYDNKARSREVLQAGTGICLYTTVSTPRYVPAQRYVPALIIVLFCEVN